MHIGQHVKLIRVGRSQVLRIPREFEFDGDEAILRSDGYRLLVEPVRKSGLLSVLARLEPLDEEFPDVKESLPPPG